MKNILLFLILICFASLEKISAQLSATTSFTDPTCTANNGTATVTPAGGSGYTYHWSNGATTATINNLGAGTYTVTVYSAGGLTWDTIFLETFDKTPAGVNNGGAWTLGISTGANEADPNFWKISDDEGGIAPGGCGVATNGDTTLFITSVFNPTGGAAYDAGGLCPTLYCPQTNAAAQSANINTAGTTHLVLQYDFIGDGDALIDNGSSLYSTAGQAGPFTTLDPSLKSTPNCITGQGRWQQRSYNLPVSCNNIPGFVIRFNWTNNDDGIGTDPSIAINNVLLRDSINGTPDSLVRTVTLTLPLPPNIVTTNLIITNPSCGNANGSITGIAVNGGSPPYTISWKDSVGNTVGSSNNLTNVLAGTYTFDVVDANGCVHDTSFTLVSTTGGNPPTITNNKPVICANDSAQFCAPAGFTAYLWNTGATTMCITENLAGNYYVTVTDNNGCTAESNHLSLTVYPPPSTSISVNGDTLSAHNQVGYQWYRNGTLIPGATDSIYIATLAGNYTVVVTDVNGCQSTSNPVVITGINDLKNNPAFDIYPNPISEGSWQLTVGKELLGSEAEIFDADGRVVYKSEIKNQKTDIDSKGLANGIYYLHIHSVNLNSSRKLIKL